MKFFLFSLQIVSLFVISSSLNTANAVGSVGLSQGNQINLVQLQGDLKVKCAVGHAHRTSNITCVRKIISTGNDDIFVGPLNSQANHVELISKGNSGEYHSQESDFDSSTGKSIDTFNLMNSNIFQSPLLETGLNNVKFILRNDDGDVVQQGQFEVNVDNSQVLQCPAETYASLNDSDCSFPHNLCNNYFSKHNNCQ